MDSTKLKSLTYSPGHNKKRKEKKTLKKYYNLILSVALAKTKAVKRPTFLTSNAPVNLFKNYIG